MPSSIFSGKAIIVIAIMMIATYTFTGIIYPKEEQTDYSHILRSLNLPSDVLPILLDFPSWIQIQYFYGYDEVINGVDTSDYPLYDHNTVRCVEWHYQEDNKIFEKFGDTMSSGLAWYNSDWMGQTGWFELLDLGQWRGRRGYADAGYESYHRRVTEILEEGEKVTTGEQSIIDMIWSFITSMTNGFVQFMKILTFTNIPNTPIWLVGILNCVFIPLWIYLVVGLAPYVAKLIEAGATFLDSITPFT